jgi:phosphatidylglycerophosphatase A
MRGWEGWLPWPAPVAAFLFFRLFDIWKPGWVGRADRRGDAAGVMLDDLIAGVFAGLATLGAAFLAHGLMR